MGSNTVDGRRWTVKGLLQVQVASGYASSNGLLWKFMLLLLFFSTDLTAQFPGSSRFPTGGRNPSNFGGGGSNRSSLKDTSRDTLSKEVYYYYADNAAKKELFRDSSFINFHLYDPIRQGEYEYTNLGFLGSAHQQLVFQPRFHKGFDAGFHHYDLYLTQPEKIKFYQLEKDHTDLSFSQTSQEKTAFSGDFSKPIGKQMGFTLRYRNIRNSGQYINQAARTNSFVPSMSYQSKNLKYRGYLSAIVNTVEQKENGGLSFAPATLNNVRKGLIAAGRPINTNSGESRYFERDLNYTHFYILEKLPKTEKFRPDTKGDSLRNLVVIDTVVSDTIKQKNVQDTLDSSGKLMNEKNLATPPLSSGSGPPPANKEPDPSKKFSPRKLPPTDKNQPSTAVQIKPEGRKYTLKHNLSLRRNTYKYTDEDTTAYQPIFRTDSRGVRNFIETNQIENTFSIRTFKLEKTKQSAFMRKKTANPTQKDLIELGLTHLFTKIQQEGAADSTVNNLFLFGNIQFTPSKRLTIDAYGHLGVGQQVGDYYAKGDFEWDTKKLGKLSFSLTQQLYSPSLVHRRFYVTSNSVWQNDFNKTFENSLSISYAIPKLKIDLTANYHLIDNHLYFDTNAQPQQLTSGLNILQLKAQNQLDFWRFHLQNTVYFQTATQDVIRFPQIYSIHRLYLDLKLFKVMESQFGGEIRVNTSWQPDSFSPLTGQFYLQDVFQRTALTESGLVAIETNSIPFYPWVDVFYNFRIQQFRFFLIVENVMHFLPVYRNFHYTTYPYPVADLQARFGFRWLFLD
ncbi:MAG: putative porin [Bacteroidota bacterium]